MGASALGLPAAAATLRPSGKTDGSDGITAALLPRVASCRICLEKSETKEMEQPCACKGTMQYAHKACVQRWLNERPEKGSVLCEVCGKPLKGNWQLWRVVDDPLHPHLAALWHLLLHGSGGGEPRSASEEWAAPGLGAERRRVSGSTAWGLVLLLAASGVLFLRQVLRVVPSTGERPEHGDVAPRGAGAAIEGIALLLLLVWLAFRLLGVVLPPCGAVHAARRSMLSSWRASRQQAALAGSVVGSSERPAGPGMSLLAMLPAALPAAAAAVDEEAAAAPAAGAGMRPGV
ncbi:hypothetical protein COHA_001870 [Chlorella ohadii]|uniref:RING-CH-type domain-containing protein n=1 Tax=Chlorella ohadii TaxID=2649997 RepID=A0AAD5DWV2_9CHLO|nr:hypothetical protein COHA_001870 [Chlorella ohadii]